MININFDKPLLLLVLIPLLLIVIGSFIFAINKENKSTKNIISFIIHIVICVLVTLALAKTTLELVVTKTEVYILADVSYSSRNNLDLIDEYIEDLGDNVPRNSKLGLICFGKDYELLVALGEEMVSVKEANVNPSETNVTNALEYAYSLFRKDTVKRIVIISDGEETNQNNIASVVEKMALDNVYIDAIYLDNNIKKDETEVMISSVEAVSSTYIENPESALVYLESNCKVRATLSLYCNGSLYKEKAINVVEGYNLVSLDLNTSVAGEYSYEVKLTLDSDTTKENNVMSFSQEVFSEINILCLTATKDETEAIKDKYDSLATIDFYTMESKDGFSKVPYTIEELAKYDEFIFVNVDIRETYNSSQFISSIDTLVSDYGKSLVTIGNTYIQNNKENEVRASLNDMLPVKYGNDDQEAKLVTILLDYSRSMEQIYKLMIAKETACAILDNLDDKVTVLVIGFYGEIIHVYEPAPASDRELIKEKINKQEAYQGTFLGSAMQYAEYYIRELGFKKNELILISDGLPYGEQSQMSKDIAASMAKHGITLSTINTVSTEGEALMQELAEIGLGHSYSVSDLDDVKALVLNEVLDSLKDMVIEDSNILVSVEDSSFIGEVILPHIGGIYNNTDKYNADIILNALYTDPVTEREYIIPLYTTWEYGNGRVSSFASNITGEWAQNWETSTDAKKAVEQIVTNNIPKEKHASAFTITHTTMGTLTDIIVKVPTVAKDAKVMIKVTTPSGSVKETTLVYDTVNYTGQILTDTIGCYKVEFSYEFGLMNYTNEYSFYISYLPEYDTMNLFEASNLFYMVTSDGQISEDGTLALENNYEDVQKYIYDLTAIIMITCCILFIVDVIIRKLRWQDILSLFKKYQTPSIK